MQQSNPHAKPSNRPWTNPHVQAWVNVNKPPKNERQAYQHLARQFGAPLNGRKYK